MALNITKGLADMLNEANSLVEAISADEALKLKELPGYRFIDLRDEMELIQNGAIPDAVNCPRGLLEFLADPDSEDAHPVFSEAEQLILFCAGGFRSALAAKTLLEMGFTNVKHITGGFAAWRGSGGVILEGHQQAT